MKSPKRHSAKYHRTAFREIPIENVPPEGASDGYDGKWYSVRVNVDDLIPDKNDRKDLVDWLKREEQDYADEYGDSDNPEEFEYYPAPIELTTTGGGTKVLGSSSINISDGHHRLAAAIRDGILSVDLLVTEPVKKEMERM